MFERSKVKSEKRKVKACRLGSVKSLKHYLNVQVEKTLNL